MNVLPPGKPSVSVREKFLERNYHYLTRCIRPQDFFTWLRTNNVFSKADEEEVENRYITTYLKAGHLIDLILTKGEKGFTAFMEVIEYTYPELYEDLTRKVPGPPPAKFLPPPSLPSRFKSRKQGGSTRNTIEIYKAMSALTDKLLRTVNDDQLQVHDLQEFIKGLKKQLTDEATENMMLNDALEFERDRNERLSADARPLCVDFLPE